MLLEKAKDGDLSVRAPLSPLEVKLYLSKVDILELIV